jgi:hypothetical protein
MYKTGLVLFPDFVPLRLRAFVAIFFLCQHLA